MFLAWGKPPMHLDSNVQILLDTLANSGQPKLWDLAPAEARQMVRLFSEMLCVKEPVGTIEDRSLPGPEGPIAFRRYVPVGAGDALSGGIVYFHGGAWIFGDLDTHCGVCRTLANESGCRVVAIDYRLAPSTNSLPPLTTPMRRPSGLRLMRLNWASIQIALWS